MSIDRLNFFGVPLELVISCRLPTRTDLIDIASQDAICAANHKRCPADDDEYEFDVHPHRYDRLYPEWIDLGGEG